MFVNAAWCVFSLMLTLHPWFGCFLCQAWTKHCASSVDIQWKQRSRCDGWHFSVAWHVLSRRRLRRRHRSLVFREVVQATVQRCPKDLDHVFNTLHLAETLGGTSRLARRGAGNCTTKPKVKKRGNSKAPHCACWTMESQASLKPRKYQADAASDLPFEFQDA